MLNGSNKAIFSEDRVYRYFWSRVWDDTLPRLGFILLNPSTADEHQGDPTVNRCVERAKRLGYGSIRLGNIFAYRSTDPHQLKSVADPVGEKNDSYLRGILAYCRVTIVGWGNHGLLHGRGDAVVILARMLNVPVYSLGMTAHRQPTHPLYLSYDRPLQLFQP